MDVDEAMWQRKMDAQGNSNGHNVREPMNKLFDEMTSLQHVEIAVPLISRNTFRALAKHM